MSSENSLSRVNIASRTKNFSQWYQDVISAADMADQSPVRGCVVFKPNGLAVWEEIQQQLDHQFKIHGHRNAYFPILIPQSYLDKEKQHISGFSPELAVVTYAGGKQLEEPLVVRPTSEAIIGSMYAKWIKSYRDLPLKLNQWANVMRWELRPRVFLRTSEFLWQEGHTAHETQEQAQEETLLMLKVYKDFIQDVCLIPCYSGPKPEHEKFPGADKTYTLEAIMQDGKALQMGTSHNLGQNFSKVFDIKFLNRNNQHEFAWTTSWGVSTRLIGSLIMVHGDDNGVIIPPGLAPQLLVIVPLVHDSQAMTAVNELVAKLQQKFAAIIHPWKIVVDSNYNQRPGERFYHWEQKGVLIRAEIGKKELADSTITLVRRDNRQKVTVPLEEALTTYNQLISELSKDLYKKAELLLHENTTYVDNFQQFTNVLDKKGGFIYAHWDTTDKTAEEIKALTKATIRVIPDQLEASPGKCVLTGKKSPRRVLFAQAY